MNNKNINDAEKWFEDNYDELGIAAAESGADRELDFDFDDFAWNVYEKELNKCQ